MESFVTSLMSDTLPKSGISLIGDISWGTNICHFYQSIPELITVVLPFIKAGLENHEYCLWSLPKEIDGIEGIRLLKNYLPEFDRYVAEGCLEILAYDNRSHRPEEAVSGLLDRTHAALRNGYAGLRLIWNREADIAISTTFEHHLNRVINMQRVLHLCNYNNNNLELNLAINIAAHYEYAVTSNANHLTLFKVADTAALIEQDIAGNWEELLKRNSELEWFTYLVAHHLLAPLNDSISVVRQFNNHAANNPAVEPLLLASIKKLEQMLGELELVLRVANDIHTQKQKR